MKEPIYWRSLKRAFQLVLHHKILWIFGVLSMLLGQLGWNNFVGSLAIFSNENTPLSSYFLAVPWSAVWNGTNILWSLWLMVLLISISVLVIMLSVVSEGALIAAATSWYKGEKNIKIDECWHRGVKHFWRLFVVNFSKKFLLAALLVSINTVIRGLNPPRNFSETISLVVVVSVGLFLALAVATVGIFAAGYVVERELPVAQSVAKAIALFRDHTLVALELSLILLLVQSLVIMLFMVASTWFLLPFVSFTIIGGFTGVSSFLATGLLSTLVLFFLAAALVGGVLIAFGISAWMYVFMKMDHEGVGSRILHWLSLLKA